MLSLEQDEIFLVMASSSAFNLVNLSTRESIYLRSNIVNLSTREYIYLRSNIVNLSTREPQVHLSQPQY